MKPCFVALSSLGDGAVTPKARKLRLAQVILLAIPCVAVLIAPFYDRSAPALFGVPFFYWWQLIWVPLSGLCIGIAYRVNACTS